MARGTRDALPTAPLVRATRAADRKRGTYVLVAAGSLLTAAVMSGESLADWVKLGFITPGIIATALILVSRPKRRVVGGPEARPSGVELATDEQARRLESFHLAVLIAVAAGLVWLWGAEGALVMLAIGVAHLVALTVLRWRLGRLERRLDAPVYQRLGPGIWREPLRAYRDPDLGDPEMAAALGRRGAA